LSHQEAAELVVVLRELAFQVLEVVGIEVGRQPPRNELRKQHAAVEVRPDLVAGVGADEDRPRGYTIRDLMRQAGISLDDGNDRVRDGLAFVDVVIRPCVALERPVGRRPVLPGLRVVPAESDTIVNHRLVVRADLADVSALDRKTPAVLDPRECPRQEDIVAVGVRPRDRSGVGHARRPYDGA